MMSWAGHLARMVETRNAYSIFVGKVKGRDDSEELDVERKIILEWILRKQRGEVWTGCMSGWQL
jgi:hypothetical protein